MPKSKSDVHETPNEVFIEIYKRWGIYEEDLFDPCPVNPKFNGLEIDWKKWNYVNPPYGDGKKDTDGNTLLARFVDKALSELEEAHYSIMLLPSKTDQKWFHKLWKRGFEFYWFDHRLKFKGNKWSATQPHFLVMISSS